MGLNSPPSVRPTLLRDCLSNVVNHITGIGKNRHLMRK